MPSCNGTYINTGMRCRRWTRATRASRALCCAAHDIANSVYCMAKLLGRTLAVASIVSFASTDSGLVQCRVNANRGPWQLFARAPLFTRDKDLLQPATRVDTTCWQLFRPAINTVHFLFFVAEVMSNYLTTDGLKKFSLLPEAPLRPWHLPHLPHG